MNKNQSHNSKLNERLKKRFTFMILFWIFVAVISVTLGRYAISFEEFFQAIGQMFKGQSHLADQNVVIVLKNIRIPRILLASLVGFALSVAGATYQGVFQNAMASPDVLGASSGAAFGAALSILLHGNKFAIILFSFVFSLIAVFLSLLISIKGHGDKVLLLVLSGMMVSSLFSAGTSYLKLVADPASELPAITYWLMGSLSGATKYDVMIAAIPMFIAIIPIYLLRWQINILTLGDDSARYLGIDPQSVRLIVIICSTLLTASAVCVTGMIGWIGLVIPHLCRRIVGNNYMYLIPAASLVGASFLLIVDNISRNLLMTEIPLGILTAFIGAPFFMYLITMKKNIL